MGAELFEAQVSRLTSLCYFLRNPAIPITVSQLKSIVQQQQDVIRDLMSEISRLSENAREESEHYDSEESDL